ncbi:MAG: hypothetical protein WCV84_04530 [Patescibacteria group bacterium]
MNQDPAQRQALRTLFAKHSYLKGFLAAQDETMDNAQQKRAQIERELRAVEREIESAKH